MTVSEQKKYLQNRLAVVPLRGKSKEQNRNNYDKLQNFHAKHASTLENFLKCHAWDADVSGAQKFYLILDTENQQIAAYFGIRSGELYFPGMDEEKMNPYLEMLADTLAKAKVVDFFRTKSGSKQIQTEIRISGELSEKSCETGTNLNESGGSLSDSKDDSNRDCRNSNSESMNSNSDSRNSNSDFQNSNSESMNSNSDSRNSNSDFQNSNCDSRKSSPDFNGSIAPSYTSRVEDYLRTILEPADKFIVERAGNERFRARIDAMITGEKDTSKLVSSVFPGIEITHLCISADFKLPEKFEIKPSVYIFWEIIVPRILKLADQVGIQYLYIFAAEQNPDDPKHTMILSKTQFEASVYEDLSLSADITEPVRGVHESQIAEPEERKTKQNCMTDETVVQDAEGHKKRNQKEDILQTEERKSNRLIRLYCEDMGFTFPDNLHVHKQDYDHACFTLYQAVTELAEKRKRFWKLHCPEN